MEILVAKQAILGSPVLIATVVPWLIAALLLHFCLKSIVRIFSAQIRSLDDTAMVVGEAV